MNLGSSYVWHTFIYFRICSELLRTQRDNAACFVLSIRFFADIDAGSTAIEVVRLEMSLRVRSSFVTSTRGRRVRDMGYYLDPALRQSEEEDAHARWKAGDRRPGARIVRDAMQGPEPAAPAS
jgi:hypothetical protein